MEIVWFLGCIAMGIFALYYWQRSLLYYPRAEPRLQPQVFGNYISEVTIRTQDGETLEAFWGVPPPRRPIFSTSSSSVANTKRKTRRKTNTLENEKEEKEEETEEDSQGEEEEEENLEEYSEGEGEGEEEAKWKNKTRPTVLLFCGNAGNASHRIGNMEGLMEMSNSNVLVIGYRGYGKSSGTPSQEGLQQDGIAAMEWLLHSDRAGQVDRQRIFVFGRSLGGAVALYVATHPLYSSHVAGLILENSFTSIPDMVAVVFPLLRPLTGLCSDRWENVPLVQQLTRPLLVVSALKDELVPPAHSQLLFDHALRAPFKRLVRFSNGQHMNLWLFHNYYPYLSDFLYDPHPDLSSQESSSESSSSSAPLSSSSSSSSS